MMKHKKLKKNKNLELEIQTHKSEHKSPFSDDEIDKTNSSCLAYAYSSLFMPVIDLSPAFNELKKMLKQWLEKKKKPIIYKNKINETI